MVKSNDDEGLLPYGFPHLFATFVGLGFSLGVSLAVLFLFYTQVSFDHTECIKIFSSQKGAVSTRGGGRYSNLDWSGMCRRQLKTHTHVQGYFFQK